MNRLTLGSLFDGSGGFPLGGLLCGITPVWALEIEPFPIRVTTKRLPWMRHPHSDSAEYKMWGNGVALAGVFFLLGGVAGAAK